jgi:hypothetical protein
MTNLSSAAVGTKAFGKRSISMSIDPAMIHRDSQAIARFLVSIPQRLRRNPEFFRAVRHLLIPKTTEERENALKLLNVWSFRKQIETETAGAGAAAKGFAKTLLERHAEISEHAALVPHLGALAPLAPLPATRWDYGRLLLRTLLEMKQQQPGLGLGSGNFGLLYDKTPLTGLEITQTWTLLGGYGHLFGTFATERALLFTLDSAPVLEHEFLSQLSPEIRRSAEAVVRERDMYRFFYVLAAWRISKWPASTEKALCLQALKHLLTPSADAGWQRLLWTFRRARQVAYTRLHAMLGVDIASSPIPISTAVRDLRPLSQIGFLDESAEPPGAVVALIDALDRFYGEVFFTSPSASERVLGHLRDFKRRWQITKEPLATRIEALMVRPKDWVETPPNAGKHFARLYVPDGGTGWTNEVRRWLVDSDTTWRAGNFLITPSRRRGAECNVVDVYIEGTPQPKLVAHVAGLLAERNEGMWAVGESTDAGRRLWRSIAGFALQLFQLILRNNRLAHLEPVSAHDGIGLAIAAKSVTSGCGRLSDFARRVYDDGRRIELDALREVAAQHGIRTGVWISFLGRLRILDSGSGRQLQELDGVFGFIDVSGVEWHFIEHKDGNASGMRGQLDELATHVDPAVAVVPACDFITVARGNAAHTQVTWSGPR